MKNVKGYEGLYQINDNGTKIKSLPIKHKRGGFIKTHVNKHGYVVAYLSKNNTVKTIKVHRLVAAAYIPNPLNLPQVNHKDGIKTNNYYKNLEWCTSKQNIQHSFATGLSKVGFGENSPSYKLYDTQRIEIYNLYKSGIPQTAIAKQYSISQGNVSLVCKKFGLIEANLAIDATKK